MPDSANIGKITGMLLEMDMQQIVQMLENPEIIKAKVDEAEDVLQAFRAKEGKD